MDNLDTLIETIRPDRFCYGDGEKERRTVPAQ